MYFIIHLYTYVYVYIAFVFVFAFVLAFVFACVLYCICITFSVGVLAEKNVYIFFGLGSRAVFGNKIEAPRAGEPNQTKLKV